MTAPASEPMIKASRPKNHMAEVGQNETAKRTPRTQRTQMPIASTRFCRPSLIIVPPMLIVTSPTRKMPKSRKIGASTRCMYFWRNICTAGIDIAVAASRTAKAK